MPIQNYIGFLPDLIPTTPGVLQDVTNILPTMKGFKGRPSAVSAGVDALSATCLGAAIVTKLDGTTRLIAGTDTKLYEVASTTWTDVSKAGNYTSGVVTWRFAQFGDSTMAVNKADTIQYSNTGAFASVATAPKASCMDAGAGFVMLAATNEVTYGDSADRWWCSSYQDATSGTAWTPSVTTQCTTGRLVDAPGAITGVRTLGQDFVAYKARSMFLGRYVGAPSVFTWQMIPGEIGCPTQEAVISIGTAHIFIGYEDIYLFDGSRPQSVGKGIKEAFFTDLNKTYRYKITGMHERSSSRVWFFYPSGSSTVNNAAIVYNYVAGTWGHVSLTIEAPVEYLSGGVSYHGLGTLYATYADLPTTISYDSPFWTSTTPIPSYFDTSHVLQTLSGVSVSSQIVGMDWGDDIQISMASRSRPRFIQVPTTATMTNFYRDIEGSTWTQDATNTMNNGKFDVLRTSRWHKFQYDFTGDVEVMGDTITLIAAGTE